MCILLTKLLSVSFPSRQRCGRGQVVGGGLQLRSQDCSHKEFYKYKVLLAGAKIVNYGVFVCIYAIFYVCMPQ